MQQFNSTKDFSNKESMKGAGDGFEQATKRDCSRVDGGNQGLTTTKSGRENFRFRESNRPTCRPMMRFRRGRLLETLTINYRMKQCLIDMGLIAGQDGMVAPVIQPRLTSSVKVKTSQSPAVSPEDIKKAIKIKREKDVIDETLSKMKELNLTSMSVVDSKKHIKEELITRMNEHGKEEKFIIRHNNMTIPEKRIIHIDDDIQIIEDLDDSVVYIGDDDCYIVDGPTEVIPYMELHDESILE
ncbi:uncharacterized protein LOC135487309 [Lineus longissimus]|uniref:uncharacterized protein LOC135487309 n=1 Tax=Lineus longissimus TaxID=88925 RepID=UPI00315C5C33